MFFKKKISIIALADFLTFGEVYKDALSYCCFLLKFAFFLPNSRLSEIINFITKRHEIHFNVSTRGLGV